MARIAESLKLSDAEIEDLMRHESRLRIATIGPGSEINLTPMTFGWASGFAYIFARGQKITNLRRNPTTTILVDVGSRWRDLQGVMMRGTSKVLENEQEEKSDPWLRDAQLNLGVKHGIKKDGKDAPYLATASGNTRRWIVFEPTTIVSWDNSKLD